MILEMIGACLFGFTAMSVVLLFVTFWPEKKVR